MTATQEITVSDHLIIGGTRPFTLLAGPCAIENEHMVMTVAESLKNTCSKLHIPFIFKASFDKANRSSIFSERGVGLEEGLRILERVRNDFEVPVVTDVHETYQCQPVGEVVDVIQIPAFLSRQTDLLVAAAHTGKVVSVKKGQFMAPWDMKNVVNKLQEAGTRRILLCERGNSFGYNNLVVDMTGLVEMRSYGYPVVFDATHSVQKPGGQGTSTGGNREMVPPLIRAALAVGVDALFTEVHPDPDRAISDGPNQLRLEAMDTLLKQALELDALIKGW
jgi:2-dehydro-3-deoxyphosphooctonate aldolase (KDO 8-P synthase)